MHTFPLTEFRANASAALDLVEAGETVRILRHGRPVADLVPIRTEAPVASWKLRKVEPVRIAWPQGVSAARMVLDERESER